MNSRLGPGLFNAQELLGAWFSRLLEKQGPSLQAINHPVGSPSKQSPLWGGLARPKSLEGREGEQESGSVPRVLAATLGHTSFSEARLDSALPPPRPGKGRQGQGGLLRTLEACLEPVKQSIHLGTGPTEQYVFKRFLPK